MDFNETSTINFNLLTESLTTSIIINVTECEFWNYFSFSNSNIPFIILFFFLPVLGLIIGLLGYRFLRLSLFNTTFVFISVLFFVTCYEDPLNLFRDQPLFTFKLPVILTFGLIFGIISILVPHLGIVILACLVGTILSAFLIAVAPFLIISYLIWFPIGMLIIFSVFILVMLLFFTKPSCVICFAMSASAFIIVSLDIFLDHGTMVFFIYECYFHGEEVVPLAPSCWLAWTNYALFPIFSTIFVILQAFCIVKKHQSSLSPVCVQCKRQTQNFNISTVNMRQNRSVQNITTLDENQKQQHLYRVRHNYGDVISKSFIKAEN